MSIHTMTMALHEGTYELVCPVCGRVVLIQDGRPHTVVKGDQAAQHTGSLGGVVIGSVEVEH